MYICWLYNKHSRMNTFFRTFFAALLALSVFAFVIVIMIFVIASSVASSKDAETGEKAVLVVDLSQHFSEVQQSDPIAEFTSGNKPAPILYDVVRIIRHAKTNDAVKGIFVKCDGNDNDLAASA